MASTYQARWMATRAGATQQDVAEVFELTQQTAAELRARAAVAAMVNEKQPPLIEYSVLFVLTGSDRAADQPGQASLF